MATVKDANGLVALNSKFGMSNIYEFNATPKAPISVSGGYIDINNNSILDENDTKLDINMSSYSNIVSPITTLVGNIDNNSTIYNHLINNYEINKSQIFDLVPSKTSKDVIILSNAIYKSLRSSFVFASSDFNQSIIDINTSYEQSFTHITDLKELSVELETQLMTDLGIAPLNNSDFSDNDTLLSSKFYVDALDLNNSSFIRVKTKDDNISDIWNMALNIQANQTIDNFDIAVHILKSTGTIGNIIAKGVCLKDNNITQISSLTFFGKQGTYTSRRPYSAQHEITKNSLFLIQNKLLFNLGYIINNQTIVASSKFTDPANYTVKIYVNKVDVNASVTTNVGSIQTGKNSYYYFDIGSQEINGTLEIQ
ncbi:hypothetical protein [Sulfurimonas sp.]|uniref:hypothetical protein n=1 Tax=Sulfurimonas sp. TaxID=2022749 RepID=UPI0025F83D98|nr:hypothetical protein [Sulfurimonas sp.]MBT5935809.1 hypothetical protein [Sulfurimonas sp.]